MAITNIIRGELQRTMMLCVDSYESSVIGGRIYSGIHANGQSFIGLITLLQIIEQNLDETNYPQSFSEMRHFFSQKHLPSEKAEEISFKNGQIATFSIRILFRQHASWQGSVSWWEGGNEERFRSALELIFLISSALDTNRKNADNT